MNESDKQKPQEWSPQKVSSLLLEHYAQMSQSDKKVIQECCIRALRKALRPSRTPVHENA